MTPLSIALGAKLRHARIEAGLRQSDVAAALKTHRPIVARTERGEHVLSTSQAALYAVACQLDVHELWKTVDEVVAALGDAAFTAIPYPTRRRNCGRGVRLAHVEAAGQKVRLARQRMHFAVTDVLKNWRAA